MTVRNLDKLFKPTSVALIGASNRPQSVGSVVARNLFRSSAFGPVMPVNPRHRSIEGVLAYPDVASLPLAPDLAVIATPPATIPGLIAELGARGTKAAVVITAGLNTKTSSGDTLRQQMLDAAKPHLLRVVGPNCLGVMVPHIGLNAGFSHIAPLAGDLAFISQSGAMVTAVLDWATPRGIGFSHVVSLGDMADVDFGDLLNYMAADPDVRAVLLYVEAVTHARKFMSALRACARLKPVVVVKAGRHAEGAKAAASHTGALAGSDAVYDAAFRRAGALRVFDTRELFDAVETLALDRPIGEGRLSILTNGGGPGVLAVDALMDLGGTVAELSDDSREQLDAVLPATWSRSNPVDIIGDAPGSRYAAALEILLKDPANDAILVVNCPTAVGSSSEAAEAIADIAASARKAVLTSWLGGAGTGHAVSLFAERRIPSYPTPEQAVRGLMHLQRYHHNQNLLMETPPSMADNVRPDAARVMALISGAVSEGRDWLSEAEAKDVFAAYGVPVVRTAVAATPDEAAAIAADIGGRIVIKILSPDITHKSDAGGVALDLDGPEAVRQAAETMLANIRRQFPEARIEGFTVQEMIKRPRAYELIVGMTDDIQFGPVMLFGAGGTGVEVINDRALALPPLNMKLAHELVAETRIAKLLKGFRDRPPVDLDAVAEVLIKTAQLIADHAEIAELDINPLLADEHGVIALDARIRVKAASLPGPARLAIRPYPRELEQTLTLGDGAQIFLRPIKPEDAPRIHELFDQLSPQDVYLRFLSNMRAMPHSLAARLTQIDYDREMALIATHAGEESGALLGIVRISADPNNECAEFAIVVRQDMRSRGLGSSLLHRIMDYARHQQIREIFGDVMRENHHMLALCRDLGFRIEDHRKEENLQRVTCIL